jgi:hypothetical protein
MYAHVGDRLLVEGDQARMGLIIGVPQADGSPPYIVKWLSNGHISMVSPGLFARLIPGCQRAGSAQSRLPASSSIGPRATRQRSRARRSAIHGAPGRTRST